MENCGCVIFDLRPEEIAFILEKWRFEGDLPRELPKVFDSKFVIFRARGLVYALIEVDTWFRKPEAKLKWGFKFSRAVYIPDKPLPFESQYAATTVWLTVTQTQALDRLLRSKEHLQEKPSPMPLKLSLSEAAEAVAKKFEIDPKSVKIQISN